MEFEHSKVTGNQWQENVTKEKKVSCRTVSNETSGGYSEAVTFSKKFRFTNTAGLDIHAFVVA